MRRVPLAGLIVLCLLAGGPALGATPGQASVAERLDNDVAPTEIHPRFLLSNAAGQVVTEQDFRGRLQLVAFGYISCPDICPTTLAEMAAVLMQLGAQAEHVQPIFISLDSRRDTPAVVREYTANFDRRILGLTGSPDLVRRAAERFKVRYEVVHEPGTPADAYTIDHSASMYLLGPEAGFVAKFPYGTSSGDIVTRIRDTIGAGLAGRRRRP